MAERFGGFTENAYLRRRKPSTIGNMTQKTIIKTEAKREGLEMKIDRETFAMALKTWRLRQGLTQRQTGARWGVSRETIIRAERAKPMAWEMAYRLFAKLSEELTKEAGV